MTYGGNPAILISPDPDTLNSLGTVNGVIKHQRPMQRELHGTPSCPCCQTSCYKICEYRSLSTETTTDIRSDEPDILFGYPKDVGQVTNAPVHLLD